MHSIGALLPFTKPRRLSVGGGLGRDGGMRDSAGANRGAPGNSGGGGGRTGSAGRPGGVGNQGQTNRAALSRSYPGVGSTGSKGNPFGPGQGNAVTADKYVMDKYIADPDERIANEREYWSAISNLGKRYNDYKNKNNTGLENFGNFLLGLGSVSEIDPLRQPLGASVDNPDASWGIDPLGAALTLGGMVAGAPLPTIYSLGKKVTGYDGPMIAFDGFNPQNQFSQSPTSPMLRGNSIGSMSPGASPSISKGEQTGTTGSIGALGKTPVLINPVQTTAVPGTVDDPDAPPTPNMTPYPDDPLKYGETLGGWKFWPNGQYGLAHGGDVRGAGDGQDDKIPALLSDGEHVWDAGTVSLLGAGSNEAGHAKLEKMKQEIRRRAGLKDPKNITKQVGTIGSLLRAAA